MGLFGKISIILLLAITAKCAFGVSDDKNEEKLGDFIRNHSTTNSSNSSSATNDNDRDDILRIEAKRFLKECGVEEGSRENYGNSYKQRHDRERNIIHTTESNGHDNENFESNESWEDKNGNSHRENRKNYNRQIYNGKYKNNDNKNNSKHRSNNTYNKRNSHNSNKNEENDESKEENDSNETEEDYDSSDKKYNREYGNNRNSKHGNSNDDDDDENEGTNNYHSKRNKNKNKRNKIFEGYGGFSNNNKNNNEDGNQNSDDNNHSYGNYHSNGYSSSGYGSNNNRNQGNYGSYDNNDPSCNYDRNKKNQYGGFDYYSSRGNGYDSRSVGSYNNNYDRRYSSYQQEKMRKNDDVSIFRTKRYSETNEEQCISQCVFGYLEVLDNSRVPSETLLIKWLQEHLRNDMKRIKSLRDARRCFGRLSVMDAKDGCEFSKSLSSCLKLELE